MSTSGTVPQRRRTSVLTRRQVARLRLGVGRGQLDRAGAPLADRQPAEPGQRVIQRAQLAAHLLAQLVDELVRVQRLA
jgi:hypothetical protein